MVWVVYLCSCAGWSLGLRWVDVVGLMCFGLLCLGCDRGLLGVAYLLCLCLYWLLVL